MTSPIGEERKFDLSIQSTSTKIHVSWHEGHCVRVGVVALPSQSVLKRGIHSWPEKVPLSSLRGS